MSTDGTAGRGSDDRSARLAVAAQMLSFFAAICLVALSASCTPALRWGTTPAVTDLRITTQLAGWREMPGSFERFTPQTLFDIIDGAAPEYNARGLVEGFRQVLGGPDGAAAEVFVYDFGTADSARTMLRARCESAAERAVLPETDSGSSCGSPAVGGSTAYGQAGRYYAEITVSGPTDPQRALVLASRLIRQIQAQAIARSM